jgi:hypothetical protein
MMISGQEAPDHTPEKSMSLKNHPGHDTCEVVGEELPCCHVQAFAETQHGVNAPYAYPQSY